MKSLHKKISAVALIAVLGAPVLSQGLVISSSSSSSSSNNKGVVVSYEELQNRIFVERYEEQYKYYSICLGSDKISEEVPLQYQDRWKFLEGLKRGDLNKYRKEKESIIIKVGKSYFRIYLLMPKHQRDRIIVKECAKKYNFEIILSNRSDYSGGIAEMNAKIRSKFKGNPKLIEQLLKEPNKYWGNVFPDGDSFRSYLLLGKINLKQGYHRYRIGDSDYIFYKSYSPSFPSHNRIELPYEEFQNYMEVKKYQQDYSYVYYDALYLGGEEIKEKALLSYSDKWDFLKRGLKGRELYRHKRKDSIIIKVGKSYFKIFFNLSDFQRKSIFMKELGKKHGFKVEYSHRNDYYGGVHQFDSHIWNRDDLKEISGLREKLLKRPSEYGENVFEDPHHFASFLDLGIIDIPKGYHRYVIGDYDYLLSKK